MCVQNEYGNFFLTVTLITYFFIMNKFKCNSLSHDLLSESIYCQKVTTKET